MRKLTEQWLRYAADDLRAAEITIEKQIYTIVCFHSQQCSEKGLKAILQEKNIKPPTIHNIKVLKDMAESALGSTLDISVEEATFLGQVYVESRYPLDIGLLPHGEATKEDADRALEITRRVFTQIRRLLE
ncbi:hypothetical protein ES703_63577 [subsurface metagenome]